jgi:hypothetical protein
MPLITERQRIRCRVNWVLDNRVGLELVAEAAEQELALAIALAAVRELEHVRVEVELELGPVEAVPELIRVAVALRTKSATGAHRQDLVRLLAAEASAVAGVETSLAPAAAGAAIAWAGADLVAVEAEDVAAEDADDKQIID